MPEVYLPQGNDWHTLDFQHRACQSFSPEIDFSLSWVDLQLKGVDPLSLPQCYIYLADASSHPLGDFLAASVGVIAKPKDIGIENRWRLKMSPFALVTDQAYCLEVRGRSMLPPVTYDIRFQKDTGAYARGFMSTSVDAGANWTSHVDDDLCFAVWGTPPVPPPPPEPPILNWAVLDIEQTLTEIGYKIVVTTNTPCHLYMYWTPTEPEKHPQTKIERGLTVPAATKYCFVVFTENEQEEAGDTIFHTFVKEPWAVCETRWFCFRAKVDDEWSPSISPIFTKHRPYDIVILTFEPDLHPEVTSVDGYVYRGTLGETWLQCRNGAGTFGISNTTGGTVQIWCAWNTDEWRRLYRAFLLFDTSSLPDDAIILSAKIRIFPYWKVSYPEWENSDYCVVSAFPLSNTDIVKEDYQLIGNTLLSDTLPKIKDIVVDEWLEFDLNAAGLAAINRTGISKFAIRNNCYDRLNVQPPWRRFRAHGFDFRAADSPADEKPQLVVTYKVVP